MKRVLVTGAQGMVGSRFVELFNNKYQLLTPSLKDFDLLNPSLLKKYQKNNPIDCIVNFAAYTDVGMAEKERNNKDGMCWRVNVDGVNNFINSIDKNIYFVHISTDMVFPGSKENPGPYEVDHKLVDDSNKVTWYGYSKMVGEKTVTNSLNNACLLRIIYPVRAKYTEKLDYLRKPLKLYNEGNLYPLFYDQQISISYIDEVCGTIDRLITNQIKGTFHCASSDVTTPFEIVNYLIEAKFGVKNAVKKASIYDFLKQVDNLVRYPIYGGLNVNKSQKELKIKYSSWRTIVDLLISQGI